MKAVSLIKHLGLFGTTPTVRIEKRGELLEEIHAVAYDKNGELEALEKWLAKCNYTVTTFVVKDNTLIVNVI